jgi:endogenous inhibitor of DNA gyrase (YacG/DUF329 family)
MVTCPTCRAATAWPGNPNRPFCSLTCRLLDLGLWLDGRYTLVDEPETEEARVERDVP